MSPSGQESFGNDVRSGRERHPAAYIGVDQAEVGLENGREALFVTHFASPVTPSLRHEPRHDYRKPRRVKRKQVGPSRGRGNWGRAIARTVVATIVWSVNDSRRCLAEGFAARIPAKVRGRRGFRRSKTVGLETKVRGGFALGDRPDDGLCARCQLLSDLSLNGTPGSSRHRGRVRRKSHGETLGTAEDPLRHRLRTIGMPWRDCPRASGPAGDDRRPPGEALGPTRADRADCDHLSTGATVARSMATHPLDASLRASSARWPPRRPKRRLAKSR
jgi:hypothetical protein